MSIFDKCRNYTRPEEVREMDIYPYFRAIETVNHNQVRVEGRQMIMVGSNNYLGLIHHPLIIAAAKAAVDRYGVSTCGSRLQSGTLQIHADIEGRLAAFMRNEAVLTFGTGFLTNQGIITALVAKGDSVIIDREVHASVLDACRLTDGRIHKFRHNDMSDLERILRSIPAKESKLVVVDGVFSMTGDLADLPHITGLKQKYDFQLLVDDAHGIGVLGENGRGTAEHFDVEENVDLTMGTFSKAFASLGGFVAGSKDIVSHIMRHANALRYSTSMTPAAAAVVQASLDVMEKEPERRRRLWGITDRMKTGLRKLGYDTGLTETPIIPVIIGGDEMTFMMWRLLRDDGVFVNPVISPAVSKGQALIRTSYSATHTDDELDAVLASFAKCGRLLGLTDGHMQ